jgi:hypothetical protein
VIEPTLLDNVRDLPKRADVDLVARVIHLTLGGEDKPLRVLTVEENRGWTSAFATAVRDKLAESGTPETMDRLADLLGESIEAMLDLVLAYDLDHVLPDRDWIDTHATDREVYDGIKKVVTAAYPFGPDLRKIVPELVPFIAAGVSRGIAAATVALASSEFTNARRRLSAGRQRKSRKSSPTSS